MIDTDPTDIDVRWNNLEKLIRMKSINDFIETSTVLSLKCKYLLYFDTNKKLLIKNESVT